MSDYIKSLKSPSEWAADYEGRIDDYRAFAKLMYDLLKRMLDSKQFGVAHIERRTKTASSFAEKIIRKNKYDDPLNEVTDLVGLRTILYDPADCVAVGELIGEEFAVDIDNSPRSSVEDDPTRFGYVTHHYVVRLSPDRSARLEYVRFADYQAEIQVRTVMQHAWAAVDHKIRYKAPDLPAGLRHQLLRLNALIELADQEFGALLLGGREQISAYAQSVSQGEYGVSLDALSLGAFLETTGADRRWADAALQLGYNRPIVDRLDSAVLLRTMEALEIGNLRSLQEILATADEWGADVLQAVLDVTLAGRNPNDKFAGILAYRDDVLNILLLVGGSSESAVSLSPFRLDIQEALLQVIAEREGR